MRSALVYIALILSSVFYSFSPAEKDITIVEFLMEYLSIKYKERNFTSFIYVAAKSQKLYFIEDGQITSSYSISSARNGLGCAEGSYQTPTGLHKIAEKVGEGLASNEILRQKQATGEIAKIEMRAKTTGEDHITSRILHLSGMEEGLNQGEGRDSYSRGIFIHGTHEEGLIGMAASKGCIRMRNADIIELFQKVEVGTFVVILNN